MRRTDANGQVDQSTNTNKNNIGKWAITNKTEEGNGEHLINNCIKHDYICANAHKIPKAAIKQTSQHGVARRIIYQDNLTSF